MITKNTTKAFTLIELLVVITIIGILATGAVTTFTSQIQKARDSTRISDIKAVQNAVEQAYQDVSSYPAATSTAAFGSGVVDYLPNLPTDPKNLQSCAPVWALTTMCGYVYNVWDSNGSAAGWIAAAVYELSAWFENTANVNTKAADDDGNDPARYEASNNPNVAPTTLWASGSAPTSGNWIVVQ